MELYGIVCVAVVLFVRSSQADSLPEGTTIWPEICRVMALYRDCTDQTFRVACPEYCTDVAAACEAKNLLYIPSKGNCFGLTVGGKNTWTFAMSSCLWYGLRLAPLKDASDAEVLSYLISYTGNTFNKFLVGAQNNGKTDEWIHTDSTANDNTFWVDGNVPTSTTTLLCMLSDKDKDYKQSPDNCGQNRAFVCEGY